MPYMNVAEVESALIALSAAHPTICQLITLPNVTFEGRTTHAVRLGTSPANSVDAFFLTGGVHAREWGSCEILVNLATDLCDAYATGTGLGYGGKYFSAAEVRAVMEKMNVIVFPCVNPDGRNFSQNGTDWRKNRNPADSGGDPAKIGVDINRNLDFLWDFPTKFSPVAIPPASTNPLSETYRGSAPNSEQETKNILYIHDTHTRIRWFVDCHSYSEDILFVWGDDETQFSTPSQNFTNPAFDGVRGVPDTTTYREYMPDADLAIHQRLAAAFTRSLFEVRNTHYVSKPGFTLYPTSGTNDDYAYSRHIVDPSRSKEFSFTVEWGQEPHPAWTEMQEVIKDVTSGLLGLAVEALGLDSYIVTNRDTFASYEVETTSSFPESFYVIVDGFSPNDLGLPAARPTIHFKTSIGGSQIGSINATPAAPILENPGAPASPQRVMFPFSVDFQNTSPFDAETRTIILEATIAGMTDVAPLRLLQQPNPYMLDGAISWLSTDVRVFQLRRGQKVNPTSAVTLGDLNANGNAAYDYIQNLLTELRTHGNTPTPIFENIPQDQSASQLELSRTVGGERVCNFAVAKVRYRANTQDATDVRVFFRTFNTMVSDLSYTNTPGAQHIENYRRTTDGKISLLGKNTAWSGSSPDEIVSIPYFAQARINSSTQSMQSQPDDTNKRPLVHAGGQEALEYFGCWLDFNQTEPQFPVQVPQGSDGPFTNRLPIVQLVRGIHQCLVAEIRFQPGGSDPIGDGATPASSDRLAQRNLAIVELDNPGTAETHVVQHTLLVKPSKLDRYPHSVEDAAKERIALNSRYDELVVRWNDLPRDTVASFYFPDWDVDDVIARASEAGRGARLSRVDANTLECSIDDIGYIPVPAREEDRGPGLLTLQLPLSVRDGDEFSIDVQQHSGATLRRTTHMAEDEEKDTAIEVELSARKVLGAFRLGVVVQLGEPLLRKQVRNLAVLKYILEAIPSSSSWRPVFLRQIQQLGEKVRGLGVDPDLVPASADDPGLPGEMGRHGCHTGKIREVFFDCFGEPEAIALETCDGVMHLRCDERRLGDLAWRACRRRSIVTVCMTPGLSPRIREFIIHARWP